MRQLCAERIVFVGGGREELAAVDAKLDGEIKLLAGGVDQLDNNKQNIQPKCSCNEFMGDIMRVNLQKSNYYDSFRGFISTQTPKTVWCAEWGREDSFEQRLISPGSDNAGQNVEYWRGGSVFT